MRVRIERLGGLAGGARTVADYETGDLPGEEETAVRDAVVTVAAAAARGETGEVGADLRTYRVTAFADAEHSYDIAGEPPGRLADALAVLLRGAN